MYSKNKKITVVKIIPFNLLFLSALSFTPKAIVIIIPPTKPPIWAKLSIDDDENPISKFIKITGSI